MILLILICAAAGAYQLLALAACVTHLLRRDRMSATQPAVSILKPIHGADDHFWPAIVSHARIEYPAFEILFGVRDNDTALPFIHRLQSEYPQVSIRVIHCTTMAPNAKVGSLIDLLREARYPLCVVNDSDITVSSNYLDKVAAPLEDAAVGLVTCLYSAGADSIAATFEALGIATDFAPSALVAPLVGVNEFGLGSTLAFRKNDIAAIGGFEAIADYIADDYQLGKRISRLGKQVRLLRMPVETHLGAATWSGVWNHQVRWARTIRLSRGAYLGLPITNASLWALIALSFGWWHLAISLLALRLIVGVTSGLAVLHDPITARFWWMMPLRDLFGFTVWVTGAMPGDVVWRGKRLRLDREGRIVG